MNKLHGGSGKKKLIPAALLLIILCCVLYFTLIQQDKYVGQAEASILTHASEVSGKIIESPVNLGQEVKAGDVIAVIDSKDQEYAVAQLELNLEKAKLLLADAGTGKNSKAQSTLAAAQANYSSASASASKASEDYQRAQSLYDDGALPKDALDAARVAAQTAASAAQSAKAQLDIAQNATPSDSLSLDVALLESQLAQKKDLLEKCTVKATCDGTVMSKNYKAGDIVAPGYNLADVASSTERYLVIYYPREKLSDLSYDQEVVFDYAGETFTGVIKFIDTKAQYTPQDLQTQANKNKESMKIKILISDECKMKPGETAKVVEFL